MALLVFRDGPREVPEHVETVLSGFELYRFTYEEAMAKANRRMESDVIRKAQNKLIGEHFRNWGRR